MDEWEFLGRGSHAGPTRRATDRHHNHHLTCAAHKKRRDFLSALASTMIPAWLWLNIAF